MTTALKPLDIVARVADGFKASLRSKSSRKPHEMKSVSVVSDVLTFTVECPDTDANRAQLLAMLFQLSQGRERRDPPNDTFPIVSWEAVGRTLWIHEASGFPLFETLSNTPADVFAVQRAVECMNLCSGMTLNEVRDLPNGSDLLACYKMLDDAALELLYTLAPVPVAGKPTPAQLPLENLRAARNEARSIFTGEPLEKVAAPEPHNATGLRQILEGLTDQWKQATAPRADMDREEFNPLHFKAMRAFYAAVRDVQARLCPADYDAVSRHCATLRDDLHGGPPAGANAPDRKPNP